MIILHHRHPPTLDFIQSLKHPEIDFKGLYYGHWHGMSATEVDTYERSGHYVCVMPEKNNFKPVVLNL